MGEQIRRTREKRGATRHEVCARSGIDAARYRRIEEAHLPALLDLDLDTLLLLAYVLDVELGDLVR